MDPLTVLVVHPDSAMAELLAGGVRAAGHEPVVVPDGERAIDYFIQHPADVLVVNLVLPGRDGAATVESIRWAPQGEHVPVVLTGTSSPPDRVSSVAHEIKAAALLQGELEQEAVVRAIQEAAGQAPGSPRPGSAPPAGARDEPPPPEQAANEEFDDDLYTDVNGDSAPARLSIPGVETDPTAWREGRDVERRASAMDAGARLEGNLAEVPFSRLLARLADLRSTGALLIDSEEDDRPTTTGESPKKVVFFRNGVPQHVRSNLVEECLGQVLLRSGRITQEALDESIERVNEGAGRQGGILIAIGAITPHELRDTLEEQQRIKLFDLFGWLKGSFRFSERMTPPSETVTLEMSLGELVYRGVVEKLPAEQLLERLQPHLDHFVVPDPRRMQPFLNIELPNEVRRVAAAIDGHQPLRRLLQIADPRPGAAAQLVHALECVGAAHFKDEPQAAGTDPARRGKRSGTPQPAQLGGGPVDLEHMRRELEKLGDRLRAERYEEALGVPSDDADATREAVERLEGRYRPLTLPGAAPRQLRALALEVCARLGHARRTLTASEPPRPPQPTADETPGSKHGESSQSATTLRLHRGQVQHAVEHGGEPENARPTLEVKRPAAGGAEESTDPSGSQEQPLGAAHVEAEPAESPEPPEPAAGDASPSTDSGELDARVDRMVQAERHFRRGERALRRERFDEALQAFEQAVALCPDEGEFLAWLGYSRHAASPKDSNATTQALDELQRGCQLSPKLDVAHVLRARVLRDCGRFADARNAYERALAANPDCVEALDGLREMAS